MSDGSGSDALFTASLLMPYVTPLPVLALYVLLEFTGKRTRWIIVCAALLIVWALPYFAVAAFQSIWSGRSFAAQLVTMGFAALWLWATTIGMLSVVRLQRIRWKRTLFVVIATLMLTPIGVPAGFVAMPLNIGSAILAGWGADVPYWIAMNPVACLVPAACVAFASWLASLAIARPAREATLRHASVEETAHV